MQPAYKVVKIQGMSAYSVRSPGPDSCVCKGIGIGESCLYGFSGYKDGPEPFHINGLHCISETIDFFISLMEQKMFLFDHIIDIHDEPARPSRTVANSGKK